MQFSPSDFYEFLMHSDISTRCSQIVLSLKNVTFCSKKFIYSIRLKSLSAHLLYDFLELALKPNSKILIEFWRTKKYFENSFRAQFSSSYCLEMRGFNSGHRASRKKKKSHWAQTFITKSLFFTFNLEIVLSFSLQNFNFDKFVVHFFLGGKAFSRHEKNLFLAEQKVFILSSKFLLWKIFCSWDIRCQIFRVKVFAITKKMNFRPANNLHSNFKFFHHPFGNNFLIFCAKFQVWRIFSSWDIEVQFFSRLKFFTVTKKTLFLAKQKDFNQVSKCFLH